MIHLNNEGYLKIVLGPMFSGKTSRLLRDYRLYKACDISCCVVNYDEDKRYHNNMLSTHDLVKIPCKMVHHLQDIVTAENISTYKVFFINEAQFFEDVCPCVTELVEKYNKTVYLYGLDGDFKREKFGKVLDLVPLADSVTKTTALCKLCKDGTQGIFTHRITKETEQKVIGADNYIPLCRKCYQKENLKTEF